MLRIEKVFLQGFKSFCDPTELSIDLEGITAVVGPNGCGKSNVADALSWVIGEQRAKALRGGKMEDVIFQGSRNRPPSGMAEVVLTLLVQETFEITPTEQTPQASTEENKSETLTEQNALPPDASESQGSSVATSLTAPKARRRSTLQTAKIFHEGERITVARRLYRSGESEYEMNGRSCRLRDIQDLFAGTGLGSAHYAIIEQGRIGQILSAKPIDRRALIEEAAGVSKFKLRQRTAELKLEATRQNLSRVTDIIAEVERQQNSLKRQAARARRYRRLRQDMRDLMRAVFVSDYRSTQTALANIEQSKHLVAARESDLATLIGQSETVHTATEAEAFQNEANLNTAREKQSETNLRLESLRQQLRHTSDQIHKLENRSSEQVRDRVAIDERSHFIKQELERLRLELAHVEEQINAEALSLAEAEKLHTTLTSSESAAQTELTQAQNRLTESATQRERWRQLLRQFTDAVERCERQLLGLKAEHERAASQAENARLEQAEVIARVTETEASRQELQEQLLQADEALKIKRSQTTELEQTLKQHHRDSTVVEQRLKSLIELDQRHAHFSEAVQTVTNYARSTEAPSFKVLGALADFIHVAPEHETMVETGLRDELQYLLVPSYEDALQAIEFLKSRQQGRATFLITGLHGSSEPTALATYQGNEQSEAVSDETSEKLKLLPLLGLAAEFEAVLARAIPGLSEIRVAKDLNTALELTGHESPSFITLDGERLSGGHLISGGSIGDQSKGILALKREIQELTGHHEKLSLTEKTLEEELLQAQSALTELINQRSEIDTDLRQIDQHLALQKQHRQQCEREVTRTATHLNLIDRETAQAATEKEEFEQKLTLASHEMSLAEQAHAEAEAVTQARQADVAELRRQAAEGLEQLSSRRADFAAKSERRRALQNEIRRLENEIQDISRRLDRHQLETIEATEQLRQLHESAASLKEEIGELETVLADEQTETAQLAQNLAAKREQLQALNQSLKQQRDDLSQVREDRSRLEIEQARLTAGLDHIRSSCQSELSEDIVEICAKLDNLKNSSHHSPAESSTDSSVGDSRGRASSISAISTTPEQSADEGNNEVRYQSQVSENNEMEFDDEAIEGSPGESELSFWYVPDDFDLVTAKARLEELRVKIDNLGPVNLMAIDELIAVEERFSFLLHQKADIDQALADTQAAIAEIKSRSRERFIDAFQIINRNFAEMFVELFGGGHGEMRLIDETDVLESGIDIIAQPPGKRLQNVLLLSGGEKAMAALALVMGIFKFRPSPFCLLDEVDAPLDEINIGRFSAKILEMSSQTQFLVITHSKRTMEAARTLYGVTMEDPGVSKLVSVKLT